MKYYEEVTGANINPEKSVGLQHGTWQGRSIPTTALDGRACEIAWGTVRTRPPAREELKRGDKKGS